MGKCFTNDANVSNILKVAFKMQIRSKNIGQAQILTGFAFFCRQDIFFDKLINFVSFPLKMNLTCYSIPISLWRIWRVKSSKFMTLVWHG